MADAELIQAFLARMDIVETRITETNRNVATLTRDVAATNAISPATNAIPWITMSHRGPGDRSPSVIPLDSPSQEARRAQAEPHPLPAPSAPAVASEPNPAQASALSSPVSPTMQDANQHRRRRYNLAAPSSQASSPGRVSPGETTPGQNAGATATVKFAIAAPEERPATLPSAPYGRGALVEGGDNSKGSSEPFAMQPFAMPAAHRKQMEELQVSMSVLRSWIDHKYQQVKQHMTELDQQMKTAEMVSDARGAIVDQLNDSHSESEATLSSLSDSLIEQKETFGNITSVVGDAVAGQLGEL